jgi:hypothetical protein
MVYIILDFSGLFWQKGVILNLRRKNAAELHGLNPGGKDRRA